MPLRDGGDGKRETWQTKRIQRFLFRSHLLQRAAFPRRGREGGGKTLYIKIPQTHPGNREKAETRGYGEDETISLPRVPIRQPSEQSPWNTSGGEAAADASPAPGPAPPPLLPVDTRTHAHTRAHTRHGRLSLPRPLRGGAGCGRLNQARPTLQPSSCRLRAAVSAPATPPAGRQHSILSPARAPPPPSPVPGPEPRSQWGWAFRGAGPGGRLDAGGGPRLDKFRPPSHFPPPTAIPPPPPAAPEAAGGVEAPGRHVRGPPSPSAERASGPDPPPSRRASDRGVSRFPASWGSLSRRLRLGD